MIIRTPDDFHLHLRQGDMMGDVLQFSARDFARGLVMPNTLPPILTGEDALRYRGEIEFENRWDFEPLMTIKLTAGTTPTIIRAAKAAGVIAAKLYPEGVTTNSADGVCDFDAQWPTYDAMQSEDMVLCIHGEMPGVFVLDRESAFLNVLASIIKDFPQLRIVLEHVSTQEAVRFISCMPDNVAATITVHHLLLTLDDVIGDMLRPHHFCKPVAKTERDRQALIEVVTGGNSKFFLGTDSAPHLQVNKECGSGCAGVFTAPVALPLLAEVFEAANALERLELFTSENGARFYGLELNSGSIKLEKCKWVVPDVFAGVVPLMAGEELGWIVSEV